ncbi:hypothetical protein PHLGIDRAFT_172077 [Phlebiopsis gigantea 11061_1 CR5-6]|uniref:Uncharacterized protein n=1 Tax=Phlebiopsis gigantea (strain 11061_1 CR5-6) TaxID=745531 RepID=A0A0C3SEV3_PHLG1|nr:hypothetical protein PHLGIDRAFT_172077 [Phlebiopsis gigantea 11061_1 CR5-6]
MDGLVPPESVGTPAPEYASRAVTPTDSSSHPPTYFSPARQATSDVSASPEPEDSRDRSLSVNSLASLGSFPSPPAHFPLPPILPSNNLGNARHQSSHSAGLSSSSPQLQPPAPVSSPERLSTPTVAAPGRSGKDSATFFDFASPPASPTTHAHDATSNRVVTVAGHADDNPGPVQDKGKEPVSDPDRPQRSNLTSPAPDATKSRTYPIGDYVNDAEFGARRAPSVGPSTSPSLPRSVERSDTNRSSNSSVVAAMRDKYSRSTGPASPPPKDIPRLPLSVSNLATRYDNSAPGERTNPESPSPESNRMSTDIRCQPSSSNQSCSPQDSTSSDIVRRRQRIQELEELELREREYAFRMKEKEIREQARELEREQFELMEARQTRVRADSTASLMRLRGAVAGRPESYAEPTTPVHDQPHPYASSTNGPNSPPTPRYLSQYSSPPSHMLTQPLHHNTSRDQLPSPGVIRPAEPTPSSRPEKPKGNWIRRLSMPVMSNAFSDNGKKGISNTDIGTQPYHRNSLALPEEDGRIRREVVNASKNRSVTTLVRR